MSQTTVKAFGKAPAGIATGRCLCGKVQVEISIPAFWAWHDHSRASRRAHGAAYATYVGCWRSRFRVTKGERQLTRFKDKATGDTRSAAYATSEHAFRFGRRPGGTAAAVAGARPRGVPASGLR